MGNGAADEGEVFNPRVETGGNAVKGSAKTMSDHPGPRHPASIPKLVFCPGHPGHPVPNFGAKVPTRKGANPKRMGVARLFGVVGRLVGAVCWGLVVC